MEHISSLQTHVDNLNREMCQQSDVNEVKYQVKEEEEEEEEEDTRLEGKIVEGKARAIY